MQFSLKHVAFIPIPFQKFREGWCSNLECQWLMLHLQIGISNYLKLFYLIDSLTLTHLLITLLNININENVIALYYSREGGVGSSQATSTELRWFQTSIKKGTFNDLHLRRFVFLLIWGQCFLPEGAKSFRIMNESTFVFVLNSVDKNWFAGNMVGCNNTPTTPPLDN